MNNVVRVAIGKTAFAFEEEAYREMKSYLDSLEAHFADKPSGKEILEEIELRIAELLTEMCGSGTVSPDHVKQVAGTLGTVNDIADNEDAPASGGGPAADVSSAGGGPDAGDSSADGGFEGDQKSSGGKSRVDRKLFRNPDDKKIAGVCGGLAAYFGIDPAIVRLVSVVLFALFFFGGLPGNGAVLISPIVAYLILWAVMPEAKTIEDKHRMKGEKNTIDNIVENVSNGAREMGNAAKGFAQKNPDFFTVMGRAVCIIVGVVFIVVSLVGLVGMSGVILGTFGTLPLSIPAALGIFTVGADEQLLCLLLYALVGIPLIAILYAGIMLSFNLKAPRWRPGLILFLLWIACILFSSAIAWRTAIKYHNSEEYECTAKIDSLGSGGLKIVMEDSDISYDYIYLDAGTGSYRLAMIKDSGIYYYPEIRIIQREDEPGILLRGTTTGFNRRADEETFFNYSDGTLTVSPNILMRGSNFDSVNNELRIYLPEGTAVHVDSPRYHDFTRRNRHSNIAWLKHRSLDLW